eukprot:338723-Pelagomonas_calceolata.AAC.5
MGWLGSEVGSQLGWQLYCWDSMGARLESHLGQHVMACTQRCTIRMAWDGVRKQVRSWMAGALADQAGGPPTQNGFDSGLHSNMPRWEHRCVDHRQSQPE